MLLKAIQLSIFYFLLFRNEAYGKEILRPLPGGSLTPGKVVKVSFTIPYSGPNTVVINLQESRNRYEGDIGLHIRVIDGAKLALNTYRNGSYEEEQWETPALIGFRVVSENHFRITAMEDHFHIENRAMTRTKTLYFNYRTDISKLKYVEVYGDAKSISVDFE